MSMKRTFFVTHTKKCSVFKKGKGDVKIWYCMLLPQARKTDEKDIEPKPVKRPMNQQEDIGPKPAKKRHIQPVSSS